MPGRFTTICCCALLAPLALAAGCGRRDGPRPEKPVSPVVRENAPTSGTLQFGSEPQQALRQARAEGRPALLFFSAADCPYCREMRSGAFSHPQVLALARQFVCVEVGWGRGGEDEELCRKYEITALPSIVLLAPDGTVLKRTAGVQRGRRLAVAMHTALRMATRQVARGGAQRR